MRRIKQLLHVVLVCMLIALQIPIRVYADDVYLEEEELIGGGSFFWI